MTRIIDDMDLFLLRMAAYQWSMDYPTNGNVPAVLRALKQTEDQYNKIEVNNELPLRR